MASVVSGREEADNCSRRGLIELTLQPLELIGLAAPLLMLTARLELRNADNFCIFLLLVLWFYSLTGKTQLTALTGL